MPCCAPAFAVLFQISFNSVNTIHSANVSPSALLRTKPLLSYKLRAKPPIKLSKPIQQVCCHNHLAEPCFQFSNTPKPRVNINSRLNGTNSALKYGDPTETMPILRDSNISGNSVPINTVAAAVVNRTLFTNNSVSRETISKNARLRRFGALIENNVNEPPITNAK